MGLFSSNKPPQPSLPDLVIHLQDSIDRIFKPDEIVSGHVALTPVKPISPQAIHVSLFGQSMIW